MAFPRGGWQRVEPHFRRTCMGLQALAVRQHRGNLPQRLGALLARPR